jgi:hypothetical protein
MSFRLFSIDQDEKNLPSILKSYPRERPSLSTAHEVQYVENYKKSRKGSGGLLRIVTNLESWMHRAVAQAGGGYNILELGGGTLNHVPYESKAKVYDVIEPFKELWIDSPHRSKVQNIYGHVDELSTHVHYDRIISIAVLEHLVSLPYDIATTTLLLSPNGHLQAGIPSEGGALWGVAWRCTTGLAYRIRTGLDYGTVMRHERINTAKEIIAIVRYFFAEVKIRRFPFPSHHMSFYTFLDAASPRFDKCRSYLKSLRSPGDCD